MRAAAAIALLGACYTSALPPVDEAAAPPPAALTMSDGAVGPLTPQTRGNLVALRAAFAGFDVRPVHVALSSTLHRLGYAVGKGGDKLLQVLADESGAIVAVQAVSSKVAVADRSWKVGATLTSVRALTTCKCVLDEVIACFNAGERIALVFERSCEHEEFDTPDGRQDLIGATIFRVLWSPTPYFEDSEPYGRLSGDED